MNRIKLTRQHLADASGLPAVLAASWEIFELIAATRFGQRRRLPGHVSRVHASPAVPPSAGRNALAFAPSMPPVPPADAGQNPPKPAADAWPRSPMLWPPWRAALSTPPAASGRARGRYRGPFGLPGRRQRSGPDHPAAGRGGLGGGRGGVRGLPRAQAAGTWRQPWPPGTAGSRPACCGAAAAPPGGHDAVCAWRIWLRAMRSRPAGRTDLHVWERAVVDAGAALRIAADCLHRSHLASPARPARRSCPIACSSPGAALRPNWRQAGTCCIPISSAPRTGWRRNGRNGRRWLPRCR